MCSLRVIGYDKAGHRIVVEEGPARGRIARYGQGNTHHVTMIGTVVLAGELVQGEPGEVEKHRREVAAWKTRQRA